VALNTGVGRHVRLLGRTVVGGIGDEAVDAADTGSGSLGDLEEEGNSRAEIDRPAQPPVVTHVEIVVNVWQGMEFIERVLNSLYVYAVHGECGVALAVVGGDAVRQRKAQPGVGDHVRQRIVLDHQYKANIRVGRIGRQDVVDGVDEILFVGLNTAQRLGRRIRRNAELAIGGQRGTVAVGQVVNDQLDNDGLRSLLLGQGCLDMLLQA
jgi:hypothetical protein